MQQPKLKASLFVVSFILVVISSVLPFQLRAIAEKVPQSCLNFIQSTESVTEANFQFQVQVSKNGFEYKIYTLSFDSGQETEVLLELKGKYCKVLSIAQEGIHDFWYHQVVSSDTAKQIALAQIKQTLSLIQKSEKVSETVAKKRFEQGVSQIEEMSEEIAWAYKQLGIKLPKKLRIIKAG